MAKVEINYYYPEEKGKLGRSSIPVLNSPALIGGIGVVDISHLEGRRDVVVVKELPELMSPLPAKKVTILKPGENTRLESESGHRLEIIHQLQTP